MIIRTAHRGAVETRSSPSGIANKDDMTSPPQQPYGQQPPYGVQPPWRQPGWGARTPPPRRNKPLIIVGVLVAVLLVGGGLVLLSTKVPASSGTAAASSATSPRGELSSPAPASPAAPTTPDTDGALSVAVGDCVMVSGSTDSPLLAPVACGSAKSSYRVTSTAATPDECTSDSDYVYDESSRVDSAGPGALCMDVDWTEGQCYDLDAENPVRVDCTAPGKRVEKVGATLQGTIDDWDCPEDGVAYSERTFVVCLETVTST